MRDTRWAILAILVLISAACDGDNPVAPSGPQYPQVAGTYTGDLTMRLQSVPGVEAPLPTTLIVVQSGAQVTISGHLDFTGQRVQIPSVTGTVNETGFFTPAPGQGGAQSWEDPDCGTVRGDQTTLTFRGNNADYFESSQTDFCGTLTVSGMLTR